MPTRLDDHTVNDLNQMPGISTSTDQLVESHLKLVNHLAWQLKKRINIPVDIGDLIGYGQLGLVEAAQRFKLHYEACFATFAHYRIRGAIFDGIRKMTWLPPAARVRLRAEEAVDALAQGVRETDSNGHQAMEHRMNAALQSLGAVYAISHLSSDATAPEPASYNDPSRIAEQKDLCARVRHALSQLDRREAAIIQWHYFDGLSLTECARRLSCGKPWVTRLHQRALKLLWQVVSDSNTK